MRTWFSVLAITVAACADNYAGDGTFLAGPGHGSGGLIRGRFFEHTSCAANASGELRCFSSCNPIIYGMGDDLSTVERVAAPTAACDGAIDEAGNVAIAGDAGVVSVHADGTFAMIAETPRRLITGHGRIATLGETGRLRVFDQESGSELWSQEGIASIAMRPDGGILATSPSAATVYAADGTLLWEQIGDLDAAASAPGGEIALVAHGDLGAMLEMHEANGDLRWSRLITSHGAGIELATDGSDVFVAESGVFDPIGGGQHGYLTRQSKDGLQWSVPILGSAPAVRILALTDEALVIQAEVNVGSTDQDGVVPADYGYTGVGNSELVTEGSGSLIAKIGR